MTRSDPAAARDAFALLDDAHASAEHPTSRLYTGFVREHRCADPARLDAVCAAAGADLRAGLHGVLLADYEWGARLLRAGTQRLAPGAGGLLRILVFDTLERLDAERAGDWLADREGRLQPAPAGIAGLCADTTRADFEGAIARIHEAIAAGETYQVNYTYRLTGQAWGEPLALYRRLRQRQRVGFGALLRLPCGPGDAVQWVLSRSPELFLRHEAGRLEARPMKGTAPRSPAPESDSETARLLHDDEKNRAENLMIVDLLRNDLGRIAVPGSVRVPELFRVEPYATVFQMTSAIEARRRPEVGLAGLLRALFPCGSITGAPKVRTMHWIAELERAPRGLYTGAIGWLDDAAGACPDLCLSVAIRTLVLAPPGDGGGARRAATLGVGGGIVADSDAAAEWDETRWKARFLTELDPGVQLIETLHASRADGVRHLARHRARLAASAAALGFRLDLHAFDSLVERTVAGLAGPAANEPATRLRVALHADGRLEFARQPLPAPPTDADGRVSLRLAAEPLPGYRPLAAYKSTDRQVYDEGIAAAKSQGAFDTLFFGPRDELLEGGRSNVFLRLDGRWYTPPLADGVLPGIQRGVLLDDPSWHATERRLYRADLARAEAVVVCNALYGALPAFVAASDARAPTRLDQA